MCDGSSNEKHQSLPDDQFFEALEESIEQLASALRLLNFVLLAHQ